MRISDWSSDVCSSDLFPFPATFSVKGEALSHCARFRLLETETLGSTRTHEDPDRRPAGCQRPGTVRMQERNLDRAGRSRRSARSEEHTSELQSLMRISYAVFCLKKKNNNSYHHYDIAK